MTRVVHVLDHSLPEHDGYSFRSHSILTNLQRAGVDVSAITSPKQGVSAAAYDDIDGVRYLRSVTDTPIEAGGVLGQLRTIQVTSGALRDVIPVERPDVLHAHSPCLNGLAALGLGLPVVYEMRSSWEDASVSVGTTHEGSLRYRLSRMLETYVARRANAIVVICNGLRTELISRGIPATKITVVPNALSENMFVRPDATSAAEIRQRFSLVDKKVIGFFGSFFEWEGVDSLVRAMPVILQSEPEARLFLAGGGRQEPELRVLVAKLGLDDRVVFAGRVDHDDIPGCYAAADVMSYPRVPHRLTDMVTPLKPLEAMAQGTIVVASDVGGHRELITDDETGLLFRAADHEDLAARIVAVLQGEVDVDRITRTADEYVRTERRWSTVVRNYEPVYDGLLAGGESERT